MSGKKLFSWAILALAATFFIVPLLATLEYAMRQLPDTGGAMLHFLGKPHSFAAFFTAVVSPEFQYAFGLSVALAIAAILLGILLVMPAAYLIRLKLPAWRSPVEFITLLPLVIPAIIIVYGYSRFFLTSSWSPFGSQVGTDVLLAFGYVILSLPYMYRAVDTAMRAIDVKTLTEAAQSLGAGPFGILFRVILPNVRSGVLSGAFVTFASLLGPKVFGVYLQNIGANRPYEPSALALIAFAITWACMGLIQLVGRSRGARPAR